MDEKPYNNVFAIPANYTDSGKIFGGMLELRNAVEAGFLLILAGYPELMWLHLPVTAKVTVMTVTLLPLTIFALMGLGGDSLLQYVSHIVLFWMRRRTLHYRRVGYRYGTTTTQKGSTSLKAGIAPKRKKTGVRTGLHPPKRTQKRHR